MFWPLPTAGVMRFAVGWPEQELPETATTLDAAIIHEAAKRSTPLWRNDAGRPSHHGHDRPRDA